MVDIKDGMAGNTDDSRGNPEYIAGLPAGTTAIQAISGVLTIIVRFLTNTAVNGGVTPVTPPAAKAVVGTPGAKKK